jgi:PAS domain S-box-containing protein
MIVASKERFGKINLAIVNTIGYSEEELLKHPFLDFVHPDDEEDAQQQIEMLEKGSIMLEFKNRWACKDNITKWLARSAKFEPSTGLMYAAARDIMELVKLESEQQKAIDELYENEEKLRLILENTSKGK